MKKETLIITILAIVIASFAFYWFEWRPTQARKSCAITASTMPLSSRDDFYKNCVLQKGVRP